MEEENASVTIASFGSLIVMLCIALAVLKMIGAIEIPWWGVFMPLLIPIALFLIMVIFGLIMYGVAAIIFDKKKPKRRKRGGKK